VVFGILAESEVDPWIEGKIHSLYASLLDRQGEERRALRTLAIAASHFKKTNDELERVQCALVRSSAWFAKGVDTAPMLTACIALLERYPFAADLRSTAHVNRIVSSIYVTDRLRGSHLATIKCLRAAMPPAASAFAAAQYQTVDGLITALEGQPGLGLGTLGKAATWFEEHDLLADAAVCWLLYAWVALLVDDSAAARAARTAYAYMKHTGFRSHGVYKIAQKIYQDARQGNLRRSILRRGVLLLLCPLMEARFELETESL
jgi:hypothetical protein